mmetsp:Transcript_32692/g.80963  ORF Transcript_32692/g.80963 Transcript_32692/m.80963 type:complete len:215 (+) Transcript_32692:338-982(+)
MCPLTHPSRTRRGASRPAGRRRLYNSSSSGGRRPSRSTPRPSMCRHSRGSGRRSSTAGWPSRASSRRPTSCLWVCVRGGATGWCVRWIALLSRWLRCWWGCWSYRANSPNSTQSSTRPSKSSMTVKRMAAPPMIQMLPSHSGSGSGRPVLLPMSGRCGVVRPASSGRPSGCAPGRCTRPTSGKKKPLFRYPTASRLLTSHWQCSCGTLRRTWIV